MAVSGVIDDPVLVRFRRALRSAYGDRLERAVLYGSRARGDARADSGYHVAVFLHGMDKRDPELYRLAGLSEQVPPMDYRDKPKRKGVLLDADRGSLLRAD